MSFDWSLWILPASVLLTGMGGGFLAAFRLGGREEEQRILQEGQRADLEQARSAVVDALRALEMEQTKLTPETYAAERQALLAHGSAALRGLEQGEWSQEEAPPKQAAAEEKLDANNDLLSALEARREELGEEKYNEMLAVLQGAKKEPKPSSGMISQRWEGALWALGAVAVVVGLVGLLSWDERNEAALVKPRPAPQSQSQAQAPPQPGPTELAWMETLKSEPENLAALNGLAWFELHRGDFAAALKYNTKAIEVSPKDPDALTLLAIFAYLQRRPGDAIVLLDRILAEHPEHLSALEYRAFFESQVGDPQKALAFVGRAMKVAQGADVVRLRHLQAQIQQSGQAAKPPTGGELLVSGTALLADGVEANFPPSSVVYAIIRVPGRRPPLAVKRLPAGPFPLEFSLTTADMMMAGSADVPDSFQLTIRVDLDGNPTSRADSGEPAAELGKVNKGTKDLSVTLQ